MKNKIIRSVTLGAATMALFACGDDITQEINQSQGLESYAAFNELPDCTSENEGEMAFANKEAKVYYCADSSWQLLNGEDGENGKDGVDGTDGKDGTNGKDGEKGDAGKDGLNGKDGVNGANGLDGESCTIEELDEQNGYKVICGGDSVGVVLNGAQGAQGPQGPQGEKGLKGDTGAKGDKGTSCTAEALEDKSGFKIVCGGDSVGVVLNGSKGDQGEKGLKGDTGAKGDKGTSCTAEALENNSGFKIVCGSDSVGVVLNGAQGPQGEKGDQGLKGDTGAKGDQGNTGATGAAGTSCTVVALEDNSGYKIVCGSDSVNVCGRYIFDPNKNEECHNGAIYFRDTRVGGGNKLYKTVTIGTQTWMAENMNYETENSYCYDNNTSNCDTYGRLYTGDAAQTACPEGFHLPDTTEWNVLFKFVMADNNLETINKVGTYLKSTTGWNSSSGIPAGNDKYGFNGLPGGIRYSNGSNSYMGDNGYFLSSTEYDSTSVYFYILSYNYENVHSYNHLKTVPKSVRCLKDSN